MSPTLAPLYSFAWLSRSPRDLSVTRFGNLRSSSRPAIDREEEEEEEEFGVNGTATAVVGSAREIRSMDRQPLWEIEAGSRFPRGTILARSGGMLEALRENGALYGSHGRSSLSLSLALCIYELTRFLSQATKGTGIGGKERRGKKGEREKEGAGHDVLVRVG